MAFTAEKAYGLMEAAHQRGRLAHAFLLVGEAGSGKTDLAARVISLINPAPDAGGANLFGEAEQPVQKSLDELEGELVRIVRPQSKSRRIVVGDIRELEKSFYVASPPGKWKVGVILHADRMGVGAENAFLKTLEEPPADCLLLLITDAPELLLPTILSRCVRLPLMSTGEGRVTNAAQDALLSALSSMARQGMGNVGAALTLRASFSSILAKRRAEIAKVNDLALKEETKKYKNTTEGDWLDKREKFYLAHTESEYLREREKLLEVLISWVGDVVRQKCSVDRLDFPGQKQTTAQVADHHELSDLLKRMDAMEQLRANLETNVQEQLALEVAFLTTFG
jgi:DNA polymerase-3 subunit delta'